MTDRSIVRALKDVTALQKWAAEKGYPMAVEDDADTLPLKVVVTIPGPADTPYAGGQFDLQCIIPKGFPIRSPSMAFLTRIWHPNVEVTCGSVCLDILKQKWSPIIRIDELYESYIPQLLTYPEPTDPYNSAAASQQLRSPEAFAAYGALYTRKYAGGEPELPLPTLPSMEEDEE